MVLLERLACVVEGGLPVLIAGMAGTSVGVDDGAEGAVLRVGLERLCVVLDGLIVPARRGDGQAC